jgi:hypothetical protein
MELKNYYLDLAKISLLAEDERNRIHSYYIEMLSCVSDRPDMSISFFNTLNNNGYLKDIRDEKIEKVLS